MEIFCNNNHEGRIIRERRIELGLTQEQVAMEIGISLQQYQRYEYGDRRFSNCPMRIGLRICAFLELDPFEIIDTESILKWNRLNRSRDKQRESN